MIATLQRISVPMDTTADVRRTIVEDLRCLDDGTERYQHLIGLRRNPPPFAEAHRIDANRLNGGQARVHRADRAGAASRREPE